MEQLDYLYEENPKLYWKLLNDCKGSVKSDVNDAVSPSFWVSHFQKLQDIQEEFKPRLQDFEQKLSSLEKLKCFNVLDFTFSIK